MLDVTVFRKFISHSNLAHQQLCVWFAFNNQFAKHWERWNKFYSPTYFALEDFDKTKGAKYKNFWSVALASTQHGWILGVARLFDPAFHSRDKVKDSPRISLDYVLQMLTDQNLADAIRSELNAHNKAIDSIKKQRDNVLAHNDAKFDDKKIEAGIEKIFEWLETVIIKIKSSEPHLSSCGIINVEYNKKLSECGAEEVFSTILLGEQHEND